MLYLIEGPVGAGKSTYAAKLAKSKTCALLNLDEWMVTLFSPDRPGTGFLNWYLERKRRCVEQIWLVAQTLAGNGVDVVLELGLVTLAEREDFYTRVDQAELELIVHVLDAPKKERWRRVQQRNQEQGATFRMTVSEEIFEIADNAWQSPDAREQRLRNVLIFNN